MDGYQWSLPAAEIEKNKGGWECLPCIFFRINDFSSSVIGYFGSYCLFVGAFETVQCTMFLDQLEGAARYAGLLLAPAEGFGRGLFFALLPKKKAFIFILA